MAAVFGFGRAAGAGFAGAWGLAVAGALAVGTGFGARLGDFPRSLGAGVLDKDVVVATDEVVVVVDVVESEAEKTDVGDSGGVTDGEGGSWMLGPVGKEEEGAGCGIGRVRTLCLVSGLRADAGALGGGLCGTWCGSGVV